MHKVGGAFLTLIRVEEADWRSQMNVSITSYPPTWITRLFTDEPFNCIFRSSKNDAESGPYKSHALLSVSFSAFHIDLTTH